MAHPARYPQPLRRLENGCYDTAPKTDNHKALAQRNTRESPLLRLPRELRDLIWTYVLAGNIIKPYYYPEDHEPRATHPPMHRFGILRVSRQIYAETALLVPTLSTFLFQTKNPFQECFCQDEEDAMKLNLQAHAIQMGADPLDLYSLAETEDPGYGPGYDEEDDDLEGETGEHRELAPRSLKFSMFRQLERLEILLAAGVVLDEDDDDEDQDEDSYKEQYAPTDYDIEEAKVNFTNTMREKNPRVVVTYREFENVGSLRTYWKAKTCLD